MLFLTFSFFFSIYAKISLWNFHSRRLYSLLYFLDSLCVFWFVMETRSVFNVFLGGSFETICAIFRLISRTNITRRYLEKMAKDDERRKLYIHPSQSIIHPLKNKHPQHTNGHVRSRQKSFTRV